MLDMVKCKVLSVIEGQSEDGWDAYLLSESSMFVSPHMIILKTCGTTINLHGLERIIEIAKSHCGFERVFR
jgi:S-adenosylmethionine decarboxylase